MRGKRITEEDIQMINQIFSQLDKWRHLPTYQLERRADIFFSLYLRELLEQETGSNVHETIIPEFPLHKKTLDEKSGNNQSFRVDYLAFSSDLEKVWLVELKTDGGSTRLAQNGYLKQAREVGFHALLRGLLQVVGATASKRKYLHLLNDLQRVGSIAGLDAVNGFARQRNLRGFNDAMRQVQVLPPDPAVNLVCIHPSEKKNSDFDEWISFRQVREVVLKHEDGISIRFAESLKRWETQAGLVSPEQDQD